MRYEYNEISSGGQFNLMIEEPKFVRNFFKQKTAAFNAILWNRGADQYVTLDDLRFLLPSNTLLSLNVSHSFTLERSEDVIIWQFNRAFYCIVDHDYEVSCSGILFYGGRASIPIYLSEDETRKFALLLEVFKEEFGSRDNIQGEMLRVLLKRLIIKLTRLVKVQSSMELLSTGELDLLRQFNLLVELHYKEFHQVQDYAPLLFKSPKTLSNLFAKYSDKSPLQIIADRIFLESKRLLMYTNKSSGEIGFELGFAEPAHFSRFFKKMAGLTVTAYKEQSIQAPNGI